MIKLINYPEDILYRGAVIKFMDVKDDSNSAYTMLCEILGADGYQLIRLDGYKAGMPVKTFATVAIKGCGISTKWLIDNYELWTYIDCGIENIYILAEPDASIFDY